MLILVQHAFLDPEDWHEVNSSNWQGLPKKSTPDGTDIFDQERGWITAVNVQGIIFQSMDHYAVNHIDSTKIRVAVWCDDPEDHLTDFHAYVWTIQTPAPDIRIDNRMNTRQSFICYAENETRRLRALNNQTCKETHPWTDFTPPPENMTRHGIWMTDEIMATSSIVRRATKWREWIE